MKESPCECGDCHLCAIFAASQGLPVKMPRQPTMDDLKRFNDEATSGKTVKVKKLKTVKQQPDLFDEANESS